MSYEYDEADILERLAAERRCLFGIPIVVNPKLPTCKVEFESWQEWLARRTKRAMNP